jgi:hypothetical protein
VPRSDAARVAFVLALGALGWACTCDAPSGDAGVDAPIDARDAPGRDSPDVRRDVPPDAPDVIVPGFVRVGTDVLPPDCDLRMATDPTATHGGPLTFVPCPGRSGCRQIDVNWTTEAFPTFQIGRYESEHDGTAGWFAYARLAPDSTADFVDWQVIANDSGNVAAILRTPRLRCDASWFAIQDGRYATMVYYRDGDANRLGEYIVGGELADPLGTFTVLAFLDPVTVPVPVQTIAVDRTGVAVELSGGNTVWRIDWDGTARLVASPGTAGGADSALEFIRDDAVVVTSRGSEGTEVRAVLGAGSPMPMISRSSAGDPALPGSDGVDLVWMNGIDRIDGARYERMELWTSPHCTAVGCVVPRFVRAVDSNAHAYVRVGYGWTGYVVVQPRVDFVDLADGTLRTIELSAGRRWLRTPVYIGPDEVAVAPSIDRFPSSPAEAETLMFIRRDSF